VKYKGIILIILIAVAAAALFFIPQEKVYEKVAPVGNPASAFELNDTDGKLWKLAYLSGKVVFINFRVTW